MNRRRNILLLIAVLFTFLILESCTKAIIDEGDTMPIEGIVKYNPDVQTIMFNHCVTCHGGAAPNGGFTLTSYEDVRFYAESGNLVERMNSTANPMPPSGLLTPNDLQIIDKWVTDGFLEN